MEKSAERIDKDKSSRGNASQFFVAGELDLRQEVATEARRVRRESGSKGKMTLFPERGRASPWTGERRGPLNQFLDGWRW